MLQLPSPSPTPSPTPNPTPTPSSNPNPSQARHVMLQLTDALLYLHAKEVIHRDVKVCSTYSGGRSRRSLVY